MVLACQVHIPEAAEVAQAQTDKLLLQLVKLVLGVLVLHQASLVHL